MNPTKQQIIDPIAFKHMFQNRTNFAKAMKTTPTMSDGAYFNLLHKELSEDILILLKAGNIMDLLRTMDPQPPKPIKTKPKPKSKPRQYLPTKVPSKIPPKTKTPTKAADQRIIPPMAFDHIFRSKENFASYLNSTSDITNFAYFNLKGKELSDEILTLIKEKKADELLLLLEDREFAYLPIYIDDYAKHFGISRKKAEHFWPKLVAFRTGTSSKDMCDDYEFPILLATHVKNKNIKGITNILYNLPKDPKGQPFHIRKEERFAQAKEAEKVRRPGPGERYARKCFPIFTPPANKPDEACESLVSLPVVLRKFMIVFDCSEVQATRLRQRLSPYQFTKDTKYGKKKHFHMFKLPTPLYSALMGYPAIRHCQGNERTKPYPTTDKAKTRLRDMLTYIEEHSEWPPYKEGDIISIADYGA